MGPPALPRRPPNASSPSVPSPSRGAKRTVAGSDTNDTDLGTTSPQKLANELKKNIEEKRRLNRFNTTSSSTLQFKPASQASRLSIEKRMEDIKPLMKITRTKLKQASLLWAEGFREACCLHRVIDLCRRSRKLLIRTGQCFLLNGFIFLGSLFVLNSVVIPILRWILPDQRSQISYEEMSAFDGVLKFYSFLRGLLIQLFYVFWFYPLYVFSIILSNLWYNDIAKHGFAAMGRSGPSVVESSKQNDALTSDSKVHAARPAGLGGIIIGIGEQLYSVLLLSFFFFEVYATGFIPYVGKALNFLLLSWMYAYYCFEYKWNFSEWGLERRLDFFETNWAFFAGFGSPCVLAIFFFSPLVSYGVMAILFPLFVLTATGTEAEQVISTQRRKWNGAELGRLPVFYAVDTLLMRVLSLFPYNHKTL